MSTKTLLVTGGAGYIGSHMLLALEKSPYRIVIVDNLSTGLKQNLICGEFVQGNLQDKSFVDALFKQYQFDGIIHFAASTSVPESIEKPQLYYQNNTFATFNLIQACLDHQVKHFVFSSTAAVYGLKSNGIVDEASSTNPMNPYGQSKLLAETMLQDCFKAHGLNYVILRYFNVAGVDDSLRVGPSPDKANHLLKAVVHTALGKQKRLEIFGDDYDTPDGTGVRDFIHVNDIIQAHVLALEHMFKHPTQALYNCGYGTGYSVKDVLNAASKLFQQEIPAHISPRRPGDVPKMITCAEQLTKDLHWQPKNQNLDSMLQSLWYWEK